MTAHDHEHEHDHRLGRDHPHTVPLSDVASSRSRRWSRCSPRKGNLALFAKGALTEEELRDGIKQAEALGAVGTARGPKLQAAEEKFRRLLEGEARRAPP